MRLSRVLVWEVVFIHLFTGSLFALVVGILLANAGLGRRWVIGVLAPVAISSWAGWACEGVIGKGRRT